MTIIVTFAYSRLEIVQNYTNGPTGLSGETKEIQDHYPTLFSYWMDNLLKKAYRSDQI